MTSSNASSPKHSDLIARARDARASSYAPYSRYPVGAALRCDDGTIVAGCNVENASFGLSQCAERAAVATAVGLGKRSFTALAVVGPEDRTTTPCGACRQVLAEFGLHLEIVYSAPGGERFAMLSDLLPAAFDVDERP